jgi:tetratricopeptide (TPR) repeat protein
MRANSPVRASARVVAPLLIVMATMLQVGCNAFKPTEVQNPNVTDKQFVGSPGAGAAWLLGVQRQFLSTLNDVVINSELVSDNYFNDYTTNSQKMDVPDLEYIDPDITGIQSDIARLRNVATFGLDTVFPRDSLVTADNRATALFYRGMANLFAGEMFVALPATPKGAIASWQDLLQLAIDDFSAARSTATEAAMIQGCTLALARAYYRLGNKPKAVEEATALLAANPTFIRNAVFDPVQGPGNTMQGVLTSSVNNLQPLPRLDFLDPKYPNRGPNNQSPIAYLKAEEAHLILAEASLSDEDVDGAKDQLTQLLALVHSRGTELVDSRLQQRGRAGGKIVYPNTADTKVAFAPGEPLRTGYVLTRTEGNVAVPTISGTSVTQTDIDAIGSVDDGLYLLYLMRQEIFIGEGRRMEDLGIRMPVAQTEVLSNPNAQSGADYTTAQIPSFIPTGFGMDAFEYDPVAKTVVISHDMNRVLVDNKTSPAVLPFN